MNTAPRRIEWLGPEGWIVWADEDGVHVRAQGGQALEMPDVEALFRLWEHARHSVSATGLIEPPKSLTREQARSMSAARNEEYILRRAKRALTREFDTDPAPF